MSGLIAVDWGTTSLRAYRVGADLAVLERRERAAGILQVEGGNFAGTLRDTIGEWLTTAPDAAVLMAGMIGSRQGWLEVPYVTCPADAATLALGIGRIDGAIDRPVRIVPGIIAHSGGVPDVIRGEETQIVGECAARGIADGLFVLPGTHSKWAVVAAGRITGFRTYVTGEAFDVLRRHSILGRLMQGEEHDAAAFAAGVDRGLSAPADLLHAVFASRTLGLTGAMPARALASLLSGTLIGAEIAAAMAWVPGKPVVIGSGRLTALYIQALRLAGVEAMTGTADVVVRGLVTLAEAAGLVGAPS